MFNNKKKKAKSKETEEKEVFIFKDPTAQEDLAFKKQQLFNAINDLDPTDDDYVDKYQKLMALVKSIQDSEIKEEVLAGQKIENSNKEQEPELKKAEMKSKIAQTGIMTGGALGGCILVPFIEQKAGPAMSKIANQAAAALFKK